MIYKNDELNRHYGKPITSQDVNNRYIDLARQLGKSYSLLDAIRRISTNKKVGVVFVNLDQKNEFIKKLNSLNVNMDNVKLFTVVNKGSISIWNMVCSMEMVNLKLTDIYIDNAVWDLLLQNQFNELNKMKVHYKIRSKTQEEVIDEMKALIKNRGDCDDSDEVLYSIAKLLGEL